MGMCSSSTNQVRNIIKKPKPLILSMDNLEQLNLYFNSRNSNDTLSYITDAIRSTDVQLSHSQLMLINQYLDISDLDSISSWSSG